MQQVDISQFNYSWWYRTEIENINNNTNQITTITFKGINYKANIYFNGNQLDSINNVIGTFRHYTFGTYIFLILLGIYFYIYYYNRCDQIY